MMTRVQERECLIGIFNNVAVAKFLLLAKGSSKDSTEIARLDTVLGNSYGFFGEEHPMRWMNTPELKLWKLVDDKVQTLNI